MQLVLWTDDGLTRWVWPTGMVGEPVPAPETDIARI
jgi:hypothetical protein